MTENFVGYRLLINVIDYSLMLLITHRLSIDYSLITHILLWGIKAFFFIITWEYLTLLLEKINRILH